MLRTGFPCFMNHLGIPGCSYKNLTASSLLRGLLIRYPKGLKGEQIDLIARIIAIAETYDRMLNRGNQPMEDRRKVAVQLIKERAGIHFDPRLVQLLIEAVSSYALQA